MSDNKKGKTKMTTGVAATINRLETSRAVQNTLKNVDAMPNLASLKAPADTALAILQLIQDIPDGDINVQLVDLALDSCGLVYIVVSKCESLNPLPDRAKNDVGELTGDLDAMSIFVLKKINGSLYRRLKKHGQDEQKLLEYRNKLRQWMVKFGGITEQSVHDYLEEVIDARMRRHEREEKAAHNANDVPRIQVLAQTRPDLGMIAGHVPPSPSSSPQPPSSVSLPQAQTGHIIQTVTPKPSNSDIKANSTAARRKQQIEEQLEAKRAELQTAMAEKPSPPPNTFGIGVGKATKKPKLPTPEELAAARAQQEAKDARVAMILAAQMEREMEEEEMAAKGKGYFKPQPKSLGSIAKPTPARAKRPSIHSEDEDADENCDSEDCASAHVQHPAPQIEVHDQDNNASPPFRGRQSPPYHPNRSNSPFAESPSPHSSYFPTGDYMSDPNLNARRSPSPHAQFNTSPPSFPSQYQQPMHSPNSSPPEQPYYGRMQISDITNSGISLGNGAVTVHNNFPPGYGNTTSINIKDSMNNRSRRTYLPDSDSDNDSD